MKHFDYYCKTLHCKMSKEPCIGRQLLAVKPQTRRLNRHSVFVIEGFYPECYACARGRQLARSMGLNIAVLRRQLSAMRRRISESAHVGYSIRSHDR